MNRVGLMPILLTVLFVGLKLTSNINWEWLTVLSPFLVSLAIATILNLTGN